MTIVILYHPINSLSISISHSFHDFLCKVIPRYLTEYLWRETVRREGGDHFTSFLNIVAECQKREDLDEDLPEVRSYFSKAFYICCLSFVVIFSLEAIFK